MQWRNSHRSAHMPLIRICTRRVLPTLALTLPNLSTAQSLTHLLDLNQGKLPKPGQSRPGFST